MDQTTNRRLSVINNHLNMSPSSAVSTFSKVPLAPPDQLFGLVAQFKADTFKDKVNLSVGAYRDNDGKPWVLPVVKKADDLLHNDPHLDHEYLPIVGLTPFREASAKLILGPDSPAIKEGRVATCQTISGTGANNLAALFVRKFPPASPPLSEGQAAPTIYISNPTWANHRAIFTQAGLQIKEYKYYDASTLTLDIDSILSTLEQAPPESIILLHACAHNPTGIDPTEEQWKEIANVMEKRNLFPFFDAAYQGFASGNLDKDAFAVRYFIKRGFNLLVCQSFAKNFGLYGERAGALHVVTSSTHEAESVTSQLSQLARAEYSNPPVFGSRIVSKVLNNEELFLQWQDDIKTMANRIIKNRKDLKFALEKLNTPGNWNHITSQIGMFSYTGLKPNQVDRLIREFHIYLVNNGRISMAGLNTHNIDYFAKAIDTVVRGN